MGVLPIRGVISNSASGNSADGQVMQTPWDNALGPMASHLLAYMRASRINPTATQVLDALGNPVTAARNSGFTQNLTDTNFNGDASISFNGTPASPYSYAANGLGAPGNGPMTASFTMVAAWRMPSSLPSAATFMGDGPTASSDVFAYMDNAGTLHFWIGGASDVTYSAGLAINTTYILWWSYDSATKIHRIGLNNATVASQATGTHTHSPTSSYLLTPFGTPSGANTAGSWNRWMCFNKAYMNGANANDDQAFTSMLSAAAAQVL